MTSVILVIIIEVAVNETGAPPGGSFPFVPALFYANLCILNPLHTEVQLTYGKSASLLRIHLKG